MAMTTLRQSLMTRLTVDDLHAAMVGVAVRLAEDAMPDDDECSGFVVMDDAYMAGFIDAILSALCQPVSLAAAYADVCEDLGIPAPEMVQRALNEVCPRGRDAMLRIA